MKKVIRLLLGVVMATALIGAVSGTEPVAPAAQAATSYVSTTYTAPKKGQTNGGVKALQQRLVKAKALDSGLVTSYFGTKTEAAVKKFQKSQGLGANGKVSRTTWKKLVAKTGKIKITKASPKLDKRCKVDGRALCIDKTKDKLYYLEDSKVVRTFDARFGCAGMRTREGKFSVLWKSRDHVSSIYHTPMPYAMFFSGGQAVHYSADFAARGYNGCSHGCVNIRDKAGIRWVFDQVRNGDRVVVYRS
ncbi:L,D-transpeptidase family protein [Microlunatus capsulatus]|uniref:Lipoprotein-anchoring transpeptidase ErfK/SrfK n=1 Tax=Microlunatus capsulatus TaxID=99117 RepID=A0ABS4ZAU7_9ACTN|nr:L,D-transpeptidase family protein [Microlunatus capsulatus]MBP2417845.1 lipoprotein-anchoring transpeptidase ErfK/SrfK [Microlunatus capsulatus]